MFSAVSSGCVFCPMLKGSTQKGCDPDDDATCAWSSRLSSVFNVNQASVFDGRSMGQSSSQMFSRQRREGTSKILFFN